MSDFLEKFNLFDIFSMLIPGTAIAFIYMLIMPRTWLPNLSLPFGAEVATFFAVSYFVGIVLHELGTMLETPMGKLLYGGKPNGMCLLEKPKGKLAVLRNQEVLHSVIKLASKCPFCISEEEMNFDKSSFVYQYCVNFLEIHKASGKADKMLVISEMSRSLLVGFFLALVLQIVAALQGEVALDGTFYHCVLLLLCLTALFVERKVRYERYRYSVVFRTYLVLNEQKDRQSEPTPPVK